MKSILKKELNSFFSSPIGYLVITVYLLINGLFLWVFEGDFNILHAGFADLNGYFFLAPWIFLFLIPAITMRSFSDEFNTGTIEILKTKPITDWQIIPYNEEIKRTESIPIYSCPVNIELVKIGDETQIIFIDLLSSDTVKIEFLTRTKLKVKGTSYLRHQGYKFLQF